jgi:hypothetical protein
MLLTLASVVFLGSESLGTSDHILLSQNWDFRFRRLLRLAGSRYFLLALYRLGSDLAENTCHVTMHIHWPVTQHWTWRGPHGRHFENLFCCCVRLFSVLPRNGSTCHSINISTKLDKDDKKWEHKVSTALSLWTRFSYWEGSLGLAAQVTVWPGQDFIFCGGSRSDLSLHVSLYLLAKHAGIPTRRAKP